MSRSGGGSSGIWPRAFRRLTRQPRGPPRGPPGAWPRVRARGRGGTVMDLSSRYLGLKLRCPVVPSASPLSEKLDNLRRMEDAGAGAVVLHSLFEEQIERESLTLLHYLDAGTESIAESLSWLPVPSAHRFGVDEYLEHVRRAKQALDIPVIASLNGATPGWWVKTVARVEEAGADAIELNLYHVAADPETTSAAVEERLLETVREFRSATRLPMAVKVGPYF